MATLLEISEELLALEAQLEAAAGDAEAAGDVVDRWLSACEAQREKLDNYAALIRDLELRAEARKAEAQRLAERARIDAERAAFLKERLKGHFLQHGLKRVETALPDHALPEWWPAARSAGHRSGGPAGKPTGLRKCVTEPMWKRYGPRWTPARS